jgi:hypothetical protein
MFRSKGNFLARRLSVALALWFLFPGGAVAHDACVYLTDQGEIRSAKTLKEVPLSFRSKAVCKDSEPQEIPQTEEVKLAGNQRGSSFGTDLGRMDVRWLRESERCFSSNPARVIARAASAVNRAIKGGRFSPEIKTEHRDWSLILIDRASAVSQFPMALSLGGHPGFMVPPNQIYIVVDAVAPDCRPTPENDAALLRVLLHEMGHVVDFALMDGVSTPGERKRTEGFASWFEGYASKNVSEIPPGAIARDYRQFVRDTDSVGEAEFSGGAHDYGVAELEFEAIVSKKGISGLMSLYQLMREKQCSLYTALKDKFGWDSKVLQREAKAELSGASAR